MASYMCQVNYSQEAIKTLVKKPNDRTEVIRAAVEKLGGKLIGFWYSFGKYDAVLILEMPDNASANTMKAGVALVSIRANRSIDANTTAAPSG